MSTLLLNKDSLYNYDIIYNKNTSRPSKTLVNPNLFNLFNLIKLDPYIDIKDYVIVECLNYFEDNFTIEENKKSDDDYILVEYCHVYEMYTFLKNCKLHSNVIFKIDDLYNYPKIQFIKLLSMIFSKVELSVSNYKNTSTIVCTDKLHEVLSCKQLNIKDFNIKVDKYIIDFFYNYNQKYINKILYINNIIQNTHTDIIYKEISLINNYIKGFINKKYKICECSDIHISELGNYTICKNCFSLTVYDNYFLDSCQALEASIKAVL